MSYISVFFIMDGTDPNPHEIPAEVPSNDVTGVKLKTNTIMCITGEACHCGDVSYVYFV